MFPIPQEVKEKQAIALFTDGACRGNPGPGAWGAVGQKINHVFIFEISGAAETTTNNKMELTGAIMALDQLIKREETDKAVILYSDSRYVVDGITSWVPDWKKRGWRKRDKKVPDNMDLWLQLDQLKNEFTALHFRWIRGHQGHPQNEYVDHLANQALDRLEYS